MHVVVLFNIFEDWTFLWINMYQYMFFYKNGFLFVCFMIYILLFQYLLFFLFNKNELEHVLQYRLWNSYGIFQQIFRIPSILNTEQWMTLCMIDLISQLSISFNLSSLIIVSDIFVVHNESVCGFITDVWLCIKTLPLTCTDVLFMYINKTATILLGMQFGSLITI